MVNIVLLEPEIPQNTGNIARTCAAIGADLHLIHPLGFEMSDKYMKRAGMDYWHHVNCREWPDWQTFISQCEPKRLWVIESGSEKLYTDVSYHAGDYLLFGRETRGIPESICAKFAERWVTIPMPNPAARSLNLSNCVAIAAFEAVRQLTKKI